jgi:hypothetical protein
MYTLIIDKFRNKIRMSLVEVNTNTNNFNLVFMIQKVFEDWRAGAGPSSCPR